MPGGAVQTKICGTDSKGLGKTSELHMESLCMHITHTHAHTLTHTHAHTHTPTHICLHLHNTYYVFIRIVTKEDSNVAKGIFLIKESCVSRSSLSDTLFGTLNGVLCSDYSLHSLTVAGSIHLGVYPLHSRKSSRAISSLRSS